MAAKNVLKNFNMFLDGRGMAGQVEEFTPPKLALKVEDFRGGGMDTSVALEMGMEKLECSGSLVSFDLNVLSLWGVAAGNATRVVIRGALEDHDGTVTPVVYTMAGRIRELDPGSFKPGDKASLKFTFDLTYYKHEHGYTTVHEIDVENMTRVVNGVDVLKAKRAALGL